MLIVSHLVNIGAAFMRVALLRYGELRMTLADGPDAPARRILAFLYRDRDGKFQCTGAPGAAGVALAVALVLQPRQILYKLATRPAIGWRHPR